MSLDLRPEEVVTYPYLWKWQRERGETEGHKVRPVCVILAVGVADGFAHLVLIAISSREPNSKQVAIEIPKIERGLQ